MEITDQILQKLKTLPLLSDHPLVQKNNLLVIRGDGYEVKVKVMNATEVVISKRWKLGIIGAIFSKQKGLRMKKLIESISASLEKDGITIHSEVMV
jgi:hypothetical protein